MTTRARALYESLLWRVDDEYTPPTVAEIQTPAMTIKTIEGRRNPDWPVMSNHGYWTKAEAIARSLDMPDLVRFAQWKKKTEGEREGEVEAVEYCCDACIIEGPDRHTIEVDQDTFEAMLDPTPDPAPRIREMVARSKE